MSAYRNNEEIIWEDFKTEGNKNVYRDKFQ